MSFCFHVTCFLSHWLPRLRDTKRLIDPGLFTIFVTLIVAMSCLFHEPQQESNACKCKSRKNTHGTSFWRLGIDLFVAISQHFLGLGKHMERLESSLPNKKWNPPEFQAIPVTEYVRKHKFYKFCFSKLGTPEILPIFVGLPNSFRHLSKNPEQKSIRELWKTCMH